MKTEKSRITKTQVKHCFLFKYKLNIETRDHLFFECSYSLESGLFLCVDFCSLHIRLNGQSLWLLLWMIVEIFSETLVYHICCRMPSGEKETKEGMTPSQDKKKTSTRFWIVWSKTAASFSASWEIRSMQEDYLCGLPHDDGEVSIFVLFP